jgi:hypothetical protein
MSVRKVRLMVVAFAAALVIAIFALTISTRAAQIHGVEEAALVDGAPLGNPERVGARLFDPTYKVVSW